MGGGSVSTLIVTVTSSTLTYILLLTIEALSAHPVPSLKPNYTIDHIHTLLMSTLQAEAEHSSKQQYPLIRPHSVTTQKT
jgi:uncharacterized membrane protein YkvI